jgi:hypothetical protein
MMEKISWNITLGELDVNVFTFVFGVFRGYIRWTLYNSAYIKPNDQYIKSVFTIYETILSMYWTEVPILCWFLYDTNSSIYCHRLLVYITTFPIYGTKWAMRGTKMSLYWRDFFKGCFLSLHRYYSFAPICLVELSKDQRASLMAYCTFSK